MPTLLYIYPSLPDVLCFLSSFIFSNFQILLVFVPTIPPRYHTFVMTPFGALNLMCVPSGLEARLTGSKPDLAAVGQMGQLYGNVGRLLSQLDQVHLTHLPAGGNKQLCIRIRKSVVDDCQQLMDSMDKAKKQVQVGSVRNNARQDSFLTESVRQCCVLILVGFVECIDCPPGWVLGLPS